MARIQSDYKTCKHCLKAYKMAWRNENQRWKLVKALIDKEGKVLRNEKNEPIPAEPVQYHVCGSETGFSGEQGKPEPFNPFDVESMIQREKEEKTEPTVQTVPPANTDLASIIAQAIGPLIKAGLDEVKVRELIRQEVEKAVPQKHEHVLVMKNDQGQTISTTESFHPLLPRLIKVLNTRKPQGQRLNVYLWGPPGSSKTTSAKMAGEAMGLDYSYISLNPQTADSRVSGFIDASGTFRDTAFYRWYVNGGLFCIDEIDNASDNLLTALNSAIDNGHAAFPCGNVARHPDAALVVTANTAGRGGDLNHAGRRPLDAATLERFVFLYWPYDEALEEQLTLKINPEASPWLAWIKSVRVFASKEYPRLVVSPRASMTGAMLLQSGAFDTDLEALAESVLFKGLDKDTKAKILRACPLPVVK